MIVLVAMLLAAGPILALELVNESFEVEVPPAGWTTMTSGQGPEWNRTDAQSHTGNWSAVMFYGGAGQAQDEWLITPALDTRGLTELKLEWWEAVLYWHPLYADYHEVLYSTTVPDDPAAYTVLLHMTPQTHTINGMDGDPVVLDLDELIGHETVYLALRYVGTAGDIWYVDDVRCYQPETRDVGVVAVGPDLGWHQVGESIVPTVELENYGSETVDCQVELQVSSNGVLQDTLPLLVSDLGPGEVRTVAYDPYPAATAGWYDLEVTITVAGDADPENNEGVATCFAYSGDRNPHGLLVTNWDCSGCPQANQALTAFMADQPGDLALVRVHGWWPGGNDDPMYHANVPQCDWLILDTPTGGDYAPHLWLDGTVDAGGDGSVYAGMINDRLDVPSPLNVTVTSEENGAQARVLVEVSEPINPATQLVLRLAVTEDGVELAGTNGETVHEEVFRYMYPDTNGVAVPTTIGSHEFVIDTPLDAGWVAENLHLAVWVRDDATKQVFNADRCPVVGGTVGAPVTSLPAALEGAFPNPFNPLTDVVFRLPRSGPVEVAIFDLSGRRLAMLARGDYPAGVHRVTWDGRDSRGRSMASGTYLVRMKSEDGTHRKKVSLVR